MTLGKKIGVAVLSAMMAFSGVGATTALAQEVDLSGVWEADNGESRYTLELCGTGTQLCALLTWIREDVQNDKNRAYINKLVVDKARLSGRTPPKWRGKINIYGNVVDGSVTLVNKDRFVVRGCVFIFCEETGANRVITSASN